MSRPCTIALSLLLPVLALGQNDDIQGIPPERMAEIKAQKVAFITQRLQLSPEEAQVFWPIYNQYDSEINAVRKAAGDSRRDRPDFARLTDAQAAPMLAQEIDQRRRENAIWEKYMLQFRDAIGARKALYLDRTERDFTREVFKRALDRRSPGNRRPDPPR